MTRALVTQLVEILENHDLIFAQLASEAGGRLTIYTQGQKKVDEPSVRLAAREYLATEPSGERAELIAQLRDAHGRRFDTSPSPYSRAADMLEADAQQAKRVPMTDDQIQEIYIRTYNVGHHGRDFENAFARAIEAHHGIGGEV